LHERKKKPNTNKRATKRERPFAKEQRDPRKEESEFLNKKQDRMSIFAANSSEQKEGSIERRKKSGDTVEEPRTEGRGGPDLCEPRLTVSRVYNREWEEGDFKTEGKKSERRLNSERESDVRQE